MERYVNGTIDIGSRLSPAARVAVGLCLLVAAAYAARVIRLGDDPMWFDEAATMGIAAMHWSVILGPMADAEANPPGFYALARLWTEAFGWDIVTLRHLSVLAGAAAVPAAWMVARRAFGEMEAWLAAALIAFNPTHVRLSQDARCYAVLFLGVMLALGAARSLIDDSRRGRSGWRPSVCLGALMGAMLWLHATAAFIALGLNAMVLAGLLPTRQPLIRGLSRLVLADILALALAAWPVGVMVKHTLLADSFADRWIETPGFLDTAHVYGRALVAPFLGSLSPIAAVVQVAMLIAAAAAWRRSRAPLVSGFAAMLAVDAAALPLVSQQWPILLDRTVLFLLAPLVMLIAYGAMRLPRQWIAPSVTVLLALQLLGLGHYQGLEFRKERWDLAARLLRDNLRPGEPVVMTESAFLEISLTSSMRALGTAPPRILIVPPPVEAEQLAVDSLGSLRLDPGRPLAALFESAGGVWLVMRDQPSSVDDDLDFSTRAPVRRTLLDSGGRLVDRTTFPGVEIEYWSRESPK